MNLASVLPSPASEYCRSPLRGAIARLVCNAVVKLVFACLSFTAFQASGQSDDPLNYPTTFDPDHLGECGYWDTDCDGQKVWQSMNPADCAIAGTPSTNDPDPNSPTNSPTCSSCLGNSVSLGEAHILGIQGFPISQTPSSVYSLFGNPVDESQLDLVLTISMGTTPQGVPVTPLAIDVTDYFQTGSIDLTMVSRLLRRAGMSSWTRAC